MTPPGWSRRRIRYLLEAPLRRPALVLVPVALAALAAGAVAQLLPPRYRASALVAAHWTIDNDLLRDKGVDVASQRRRAVWKRATQRTLLESVLRETAPAPARSEPAVPLDVQVERLVSKLSVRPMASSSFLIEFVDRDPALAALVPNRVAKLLAEDAEPARSGAADELIEARLADARRVLQQKTEAFNRAAQGVAQSPGGHAEAPQVDQKALAEWRVVAAALAAAHARAERLRMEIEAGRSGAAEALATQLERLRGELAELRQRYTEEHPDVRELRHQIAQLEASLPPPGADPVASAERELRDTQAEIERLAARLTELERMTTRVPQPPTRRTPPAIGPDQDPELALRERARAQQAYQALLDEWQAAQSTARLEADGIARLELLRAAEVPGAPESTRPYLLVLAGALVGLASGLLATAVAELRDDRVKGPEDLEHILPVPLLTTLPEVRGRATRRS